MRKALVISDPACLDRIPAAEKSGFVFFCTNESVHYQCRAMGLPAALLEESWIGDEYARINTWAYRVAWALLERFKSAPEKFLRLNAAFIDAKAAVVETLKIVRVIEKIRETCPVSRICFLETEKDSFLASVCRAGFGPDQVGTVAYGDGGAAEPVPVFSWKARLYAFFARRASADTGRTIGAWEKTGRRFLFVSGALVHLAPVLDRLAKDGQPVLYGENEFNLEKYRYCRARGIRFCVLPKGDARRHPFGQDEVFFRPGSAVYEGKDVSAIAQAAFTAALANGLIRNPYEETAARKIFLSPALQGVLLDEDFSSRRFFYALAEEHRKKSFVISHGVPALLLEQEADCAGRYDTAVTFVHSEFEKSAYESIYCDPRRLRVTGLPRYDRLTERVEKPETTFMSIHGSASVLYCGSVLADYDFKQFYTVLGCKEFLGDFAKRYLRDLLDLTAERGAVLEIKPHFNEEAGWEACIRAHAPQARYRLHSHRQDLIELIRKSDVVVTPESSVICEAIMLHKPVIVLNYGAQPLASAHYEGRKMVWHARDTEGLREGLKQCLQSADYLAVLKDARSQSFGFFAGAFDGAAGARVAAEIQAAVA